MVNKEMKFLDNGDIRYEIVDEAARTGLANKITSPTTSGTEGQVLTIDANGNPKWDNTSFVKVTDDGQGNVSMETLYGVLIDAAPAQNSNNLVTSSGIYTAINTIMSNYALKSEIPTVTNDFTDAYKDKVDSLWEDYQDALTALG